LKLKLMRLRLCNDHKSLRLGITYGRNETISPTRNGLNKTWFFGIVPERLPDFANCAIDAVVGVKENVLAPDSLDDVLAAHELSSLLNQDGENFHGNALQFEHTTRTTQPAGA
jgi:hypothetical protein